MEFGIA